MRKPSPAAARETKGRMPAGQAKVKERIDVALVARGLCESREKAARLLLAGAVFVALALLMPSLVLFVPMFLLEGKEKKRSYNVAILVGRSGRSGLDLQRRVMASQGLHVGVALDQANGDHGAGRASSSGSVRGCVSW